MSRLDHKGTAMIRNNTVLGVTCYFRFENIKVFAKIETGPEWKRSYHYEPTKVGLKIARICASEVGKGNVVEYTETLQPNGEITASGLVRNPMGF